MNYHEVHARCPDSTDRIVRIYIFRYAWSPRCIVLAVYDLNKSRLGFVYLAEAPSTACILVLNIVNCTLSDTQFMNIARSTRLSASIASSGLFTAALLLGPSWSPRLYLRSVRLTRRATASPCIIGLSLMTYSSWACCSRSLHACGWARVQMRRYSLLVAVFWLAEVKKWERNIKQD